MGLIRRIVDGLTAAEPASTWSSDRGRRFWRPRPASEVDELEQAHASGLVSEDDYESMKLQLDAIEEAKRRPADEG